METITYFIKGEILEIHLEGDILHFENVSLQRKIIHSLEKNKVRKIDIHMQKVKEWDSTFLAWVLGIINYAHKNGIKINQEEIPTNFLKMINLALIPHKLPVQIKINPLSFIEKLGQFGIQIFESFRRGLKFIIGVKKSFVSFLFGRSILRLDDFWFALGDCSYKAVGIVSLVSFMVGLILAFVGAIQLQPFGAQVYVASLVAIGMTRIMGAIMMGIIMAGRTGASYAASIGTMQVNEEIDALKTMGISPIDFLVIPRLFALVITMPFLTLLADVVGILGGATVGILMLDIAGTEYFQYTQNALTFNNFWVGVFYSFVYGWIIALCGCYFGINAGKDADSVGKATTNSVVYSIVWMIVATGILTVLFKVINV